MPSLSSAMLIQAMTIQQFVLHYYENKDMFSFLLLVVDSKNVHL